MASIKLTTLFKQLAMLLLLFHAVIGTSTNATNSSLYCLLGSENSLSVKFSVPKINGGIPNDVSVYYQSVKDNKWMLGKIFQTNGKEEISDWIEMKLTPSTLYKVRAVVGMFSGQIIGECEFCSHSDNLEQVRNLTTHSVGHNWFAFTWTMPPLGVCPKEIKYDVSYHDSREPTAWQEWREVPGYPLTLNTGEKYLMIMNGVRPDENYEVLFVLKVEEGRKFRSKISTLRVKTHPDPAPLVMTEPPIILHATNTTFRVTAHANCKHECIITWQYKEPIESKWHFAGKRRAVEDMEITGLNATTVYQVRALLQRGSECEPFASDDLPFAENTTFPLAEPKILDYPPSLVNATNTTLTMETNCVEECKGYIAHWEYKGPNFTDWKYAGQQSALKQMIITGLTPDSSYDVRINLQWPHGARMNESGPEDEAETCPNHILPVQRIYTEERTIDSITIAWGVQRACSPPHFLVRWKDYDAVNDTSHEFPSNSFDGNGCPVNATFINNTSTCYDYRSDFFCFTADTDISPATRYVFEVTPIDWEGKCGEPRIFKTGSLWKYWGGITVGLWCLIVISVLVLFGTVPACVALQRRLSARVAAGRDVAFSSASHISAGDYEEVDGIGFSEPSTRILERRSQSPNA